MDDRRLAGQKLIGFFTTNPWGEEILEGTMGGVLAGASQLGSDQSIGQTALETAAAIAGGIGMGALGRRLGARIGKRIHKDDLRDQQGMLATIGRVAGSETTASGLRDQGVAMKAAIQEGLVQQTSARMAREAAVDPAGFAARYGVTREQFDRMIPQVSMGRNVAAAAKTLESLTPEQRTRVLNELMSDYEAVENAVARNASTSIDDVIREVSKMKDTSTEIPGTGKTISQALESLLNPAPPITGEHVGRAVGRFLGDEVGVIGGLAAGSVLAQQLGMESPKDRRIRELEAQLQGGR